MQPNQAYRPGEANWVKQCRKDGEPEGVDEFDVPCVNFDFTEMALHIAAKLKKAVNIPGANVTR